MELGLPLSSPLWCSSVHLNLKLLLTMKAGLVLPRGALASLQMCRCKPCQVSSTETGGDTRLPFHFVKEIQCAVAMPREVLTCRVPVDVPNLQTLTEVITCKEVGTCWS